MIKASDWAATGLSDPLLSQVSVYTLTSTSVLAIQRKIEIVKWVYVG